MKKNAIEIKTRKKKHDGQCVNSRLHLVMLETDEDIKAVFKIICTFGESCIASLNQRFDEVAEVFKVFKLFEPEGHSEVAEETRLALVLAVCCGAEQGTCVADMRELLSAKGLVLKDNADLRLDSKRNIVWKHVFQEVSKTPDVSWHTPAVKFVVSYFVLQAQSAYCEAMLSRRSHIKRSLMGQGDARLYNIYAQVQSNLEGGLHAGPAKDLIKCVVARYAVARERRGAVRKSQVPMPGRARAR